MEVAAGFTEHVDVQVGRIVDEIDKLGYGDNTLIFYIWGDNGSSAEGQDGTISELLAQNGIPDHDQAAHRGARGTRRPRRARLAQDRQHVPRGMGLGRQHAVQGHEAAGLAFRRHAQPDGRPLAGEDQARRDAAAAVSPLQRRRPDDLRDPRHHPAAHGERRPAGPDRRREFRLLVRRSEGQRAAAHAVLRDHGQPRHLSRRLDGLAPSARASLGCRAAARHSGVDARQGRLGTLQPRRGLEPGQRPRRQDAGEAGPDEGALPHRGGEEQSAADRRRPLGSRASPGAAHRPAVHGVDFRRRHGPHAGVLRAGARQQAQRRHHRRRHPRQRQRRALQTGRELRRPHLLRRGRHPLLRVQPLHHPAHEDPRQGEAARPAR